MLCTHSVVPDSDAGLRGGVVRPHQPRLSKSRRLALIEWISGYFVHDDVVCATVRYLDMCTRRVPFEEQVVTFTCAVLACKIFSSCEPAEKILEFEDYAHVSEVTTPIDELRACEMSILKLLLEDGAFAQPLLRVATIRASRKSMLSDVQENLACQWVLLLHLTLGVQRYPVDTLAGACVRVAQGLPLMDATILPLFGEAIISLAKCPNLARRCPSVTPVDALVSDEASVCNWLRDCCWRVADALAPWHREDGHDEAVMTKASTESRDCPDAIVSSRRKKSKPTIRKRRAKAKK
tara:strand:+ start:210 stop:1091 length:882 start_codon:yes stop_codon:yes gene_type:complete